MRQALFLVAISLCLASCFVQPGMPLRAPAAASTMQRAQTAPNMMVEAETATTLLNTIGQLSASNSGDFGGYTFPIVGLGLLAATISFLAGPVED